MCHFMSGIIQYKHKGVWFDVDLDHHTDIMAKFGIKDEKDIPTFVKFEITPKDGDVFNHNKDNWKYNTDQDNVPDWFDASKAAEQAWNALQEVFAARFLIGTTDERTLSEGRWFVKDAKLKSLTGTANIQQMRGTSQVGVMRETSKVGVMRGTSKVEKMYDQSMTVRDLKITVCDKRFTIEYVETNKC